MLNGSGLNEKWIKASILGTIWASSEIVFGSFLHNLKIPFSGNILTGIALVFLISVSFIWKEKGLFWRAGIITALMKTMSPSAVIFGPMIAIFAEALLLETSIRIFGRTVFGYITGAALAMSWNLFQKIANYIIFYGNNIIELYSKLIKMAQKQLHIQSDIIWIPILSLLAIYVILGVISAIFGIKIGEKLKKRSEISTHENSTRYSDLGKKMHRDFNYSITWLLVDIVLILGSLLLLSYTSAIYWSISIVTIVVIWIWRYKRAMRQIARIKFWISFVIITMLITLVFNSETSPIERIVMGIQMNFRAAIMILGFTVLGTELYNPKIRVYFKSSYFRQLSVAMELSFESLPLTIAHIPSFRDVLKNPITLLFQITSQAERRLEEIKTTYKRKPQILIISGKIGQGKTSCVKCVIEELRKKGVQIGGIYSKRIITENKTNGYDIVDVKTGDSHVFLRDSGESQFERIGKYYIYPGSIEKGNQILYQSKMNDDFVIIDEVGRFELENKGWTMSIQDLICSSVKYILIVIRDTFVEELLNKWSLNQVSIYDISTNDCETVNYLILEKIRNEEYKNNI